MINAVPDTHAYKCFTDTYLSIWVEGSTRFELRSTFLHDSLQGTPSFHRHSFFPPTGEESRDRIKIAGAISRTHDIGENAAEALIMADTRRAVAATTFQPLTQDSHYTNVPPITRPSAVCTPPNPALFLNHSNQNHAKRCRSRVASASSGHAANSRRLQATSGLNEKILGTNRDLRKDHVCPLILLQSEVVSVCTFC